MTEQQMLTIERENSDIATIKQEAQPTITKQLNLEKIEQPQTFANQYPSLEGKIGLTSFLMGSSTAITIGLINGYLHANGGSLVNETKTVAMIMPILTTALGTSITMNNKLRSKEERTETTSSKPKIIIDIFQPTLGALLSGYLIAAGHCAGYVVGKIK